jgi:outer membrane protein TolC
LDVLDANQELKDAELALLEAQRDSVNAYYNLLAAIGMLGHESWDKL